MFSRGFLFCTGVLPRLPLLFYKPRRPCFCRLAYPACSCLTVVVHSSLKLFSPSCRRVMSTTAAVRRSTPSQMVLRRGPYARSRPCVPRPARPLLSFKLSWRSRTRREGLASCPRLTCSWVEPSELGRTRVPDRRHARGPVFIVPFWLASVTWTSLVPVVALKRSYALARPRS
jgi:hypothetical protein